MRNALVAISALLLATFLLVAGNGLQTTLIAIRANLEGFPLWLIGSLLSAYFVGFIAGCRMTPVMVKRVGHIRTFTALASIASASALAHALVVDSWAWLPLRTVTGFCLAGLQMILESWINERATNQTRGRVLAVYRIVDLSATTAGQVLLTLASPAGFALFAVISILISLSLVPVALTTAVAPQPIATARLNIAKLVVVSPLAVATSFAVGTANGAFWAVGPVYVQRIGYDINAVAAFMSAVIVAGALAQWPLGYLSDKIDRRQAIIATAVGAAAAAALLAVFGATSFSVLAAAGAVFGFFAMPLFGLGAALANDHAETSEFVEISGGLFLVYGVGSIIGPIVTPAIMEVTAAPALFACIAVIYAGLVVFGLYRLSQRAPVPLADQEEYVPVPRTTPAVFELDPRGPEESEDPAPDRENERPS